MRSLYARLHVRFGTPMSSTERRSHMQEKISGLQRHFAVVNEMRALRAERSPSQRRNVVIVGGGFAGLMAAYTLSGLCNVTVFEARERFGGRVWTKNRNSGIVEAGGELIGYNHPQWLTLAQKFDLGFSAISTDANYDALGLDEPVYINGAKQSDSDLKLVYKEMERAFNEMSEEAHSIDPHLPWTAANAHELDNKPVSEWIAGLPCHELTMLAIEQQLSNDGGAPTSRQSYLANLAVVAGGALPRKRNAFFSVTETLRCSEGNQALANRLADAVIEAGGTIHLSTPVRAIHVSGGGASVEPARRPAVHADHVVLAIPPNLWPGQPAEKIAIHPPLSPKYHVTMGTAVKYLSPLKRRFWIRENLSPSSTSDQFGVTWEGTDNQIAAPGRDAELSLFAGGAVAHAALDEYDRGGLSAVREFYKRRIGAVYDGYAESCEQASEKPDFIAWPRDEWTAGGYSCPAPGEVCKAGPLLHDGLHDRLFFAGEHTCPAYYGYMEGALHSGKRVAGRILQL